MKMASTHDVNQQSLSQPGHSPNKESHEKTPYQPEEIFLDQETYTEPEPPHLSVWKLILLTFALSLLVFCIGVDNTIISTAIPKITDQFKALEDVGWYASAYLITTAAFQIIFGRLFTLFSIKWVYLIGIVIFEVGSFICGIAPSSLVLIIGRAIAGVGGGGLFTGSMLIISQSVPQRLIPLYIGVLAAVYGLAGVCGPLLGGVFTDNAKLTWRWAFYINCPLGVLTIIAIILFYEEPKALVKNQQTFKARLAQLDFLGISLLLPAVISLILGVTWGGIEHPWKSSHVISTLVIGVVLFILFGIVQVKKGERAMIPARIASNRNVYGAAIFGFFTTGAFFILLYYMPIWFQAIRNVSASQSGILNLPLIIGMVIFLGITGLIITFFGYYSQFYYIAPVFIAIGMGLCTTLTVTTTARQYIGFQAIAGIGFGFGMMLPLVTMQACLDHNDIAIGVAITIFGQTLGGAILMSGAQNIFLNKLASSIASVMPGFDVRVFLLTGATKLREMVPAEVLPQVLVGYNSALTNAIKFGTAVACVAILAAPLIQWKSIKGKQINMTAV